MPTRLMWLRAPRPSLSVWRASGCPAGLRIVGGAPLGSAPVGGARGFCDDKTPKWHARYPHRYFNFKEFRKALRVRKEALSQAEVREISREYAPPPPEGWTVLTFLERMEFGDGAEDVANLFERWEDFISMSPKDCLKIRDITGLQRRRLARHIVLFTHGLWPPVSRPEYLERFDAKPMEREGHAWTPEEDAKLLELAELYDVNFGDPWMYLAWELKRREHEVSDRYTHLVVKPRERASFCEFAITKSSRPLLMNRHFRLIPPDLYVVPSEENFTLARCNFQLPPAFQAYRQNDIF